MFYIGINKAISELYFKSGSSGNKDSEFKVTWDKIVIADFNEMVINKNFEATFNPKKQTIEFVMTDFLLRSNVFDMIVEYIPKPITRKKALFKCHGNGIISIKNYNISLSYFMMPKSKNILSENRNKKINISDCELDIKLKNDSVKIVFPENDMPLIYNFSDKTCEATIGESSAIQGVIEDTLHAYFKYILPILWDNQLQKSLYKFVAKEQWLHTTYDNITNRELICYTNNTILDNERLFIGAELIYNQSINQRDRIISHNMTDPQINNMVDPMVFDSILSGFIIFCICCLIGTITTLKCLKQCLCGCRRKKRKPNIDDLHNNHLLIVDNINNGDID